MRTGKLHPEEVTRGIVGLVLVGVAIVALDVWGEALAPGLAFFDLEIADAKMFLIFYLFFLALLRLLGSTIFRPYLALNDAREARIEGQLHTAEDLRAKAAALTQRTEHTLQEVRIAALKNRAEVLTQAKQQAQAILSEGEAAAATLLAEGRSHNDREVQQLRRSLSERENVLAEELATRIMA